jgi:putative oxidoreductase
MRIATIVARILLGVAFTAAGVIGFIVTFTVGPQPVPGYPLAEQFQSVAFHSHYVVFIQLVQFVTGIALLVNRYVALALMASAAVLANILVYHITMMPIAIFPGLVLCVCWYLVALQVKPVLLPLLQAKPETLAAGG